MRKVNDWILEIYPEYFFKDRHDNIYPYFKDDIYKNINPYDPSTFINILKEMDYPFFEEEWFNVLRISLIHAHDMKTTFGKYISKMRLKFYQNFTFKDSIYSENIENIEYEIHFTTREKWWNNEDIKKIGVKNEI